MPTTPTYQTDPAAFARDFLGILLQPYQVKALKADAVFVTLLKGRQVGGSTAMRVKALWDCYRFPGHLVLFLSASDRQSQEQGERMLEAIQDAPIARSLKTATAERITFTNGSSIYLLPNNPATIRGYSARRSRRKPRGGVTVLFDECCHAPDGDATRRAIEYTTATAPPGRKFIWFVSTPTTSTHWVSSYYERGRGKGKLPGYFSARWPSALNKYVDTTWLAHMRETRLPAEIACEVDGVFADAMECLFAPLLPAATHDLAFPVPGQLGCCYTVGLDLILPFALHGKSRAAAVLLAQTPEWTYQVADCWAGRDYTDDWLLDKVMQWCQQWGVQKILCESFAATGIMEGALVRGLPVEIVPPSPQRQAAGYTKLFLAARDGRLSIPAAATDLLSELRTLSHTMQPSGVPKFAAASGKRDDLCDALMWAMVATVGSPPRSSHMPAGSPEGPLRRMAHLGPMGDGGYTVIQRMADGSVQAHSPGEPSEGYGRIDWRQPQW